jgi:DNA primase
VNAETGLGNCFHGACGIKFNKFKLVRAVSGLSGAELDAYIKVVAEEQGWMPKKEHVKVIQADLKLPSKIHHLPVNGQNLQYLQDRGVSIDSCKWFQLSYCHGGWWGYKLEDGAEKWVSYDQRIIIPITDLDGRMVSFQGRDITDEKLPKYLFPVGYAVAGSHLYNAQNFQNGIHAHAVVGEGAFDAIAIHQAIEGRAECSAMLAIATFGMHLSGGEGGQIAKLLRLYDRGLRTITFMWDSEGKALAYAVKCGLQLIGMGFTVRIAQLPAGYDPAQGPDKKPTPPGVVLKALFEATRLDKLNAIRLLHQAARMSEAEAVK